MIMTPASRTTAVNIRARLIAASPKLRRIVGVTGGVFAIATLIGACDRTGPSEVERTASASSSKMRIPMEDESANNPGALSHGDVAGVTAVVTDWDAAWNAGNANAIAAQFVDDAEFINGRGQIALGVAAIRANHAASLAGVFKGSHTQGTIRRITFVGEASAVVDVDNVLTNFTSLPPGTVPTAPGMQSGRHKRLVVKRGGTWRVVLMQITTIAPAVPPAP
jgi:uncharacterized protein (TIGR02246 family)